MKKGEKMSDEQKRKISESEKGRIGTWKDKKRPPFSKEWCEKISQNNKGVIPWNKGKKELQKHSEETKRKMSLSHKGKKYKPRSNPMPEEQRKQISLFHKGRKLSDNAKEKIRKRRAIQIIPMRDSKPERMMQVALTLNGIKFEKHRMITNGKGFYHQVDILIDNKFCIEIDGEHWHANPDRYDPEYQITKTKKAKDVWARDIKVNYELGNMGYFVLRIWEKDVYRNTQGCAEKIIETIKQKIKVAT